MWCNEWINIICNDDQLTENISQHTAHNDQFQYISQHTAHNDQFQYISQHTAQNDQFPLDAINTIKKQVTVPNFEIQ